MSNDNVKSLFGGDVIHPDDEGKLPEDVKENIKEQLEEIIERVMNDEIVELSLVGRLAEDHAPWPVIKLYGQIANPMLMRSYIQTCSDIYTECYINPTLFGFEEFEE